MKPAPFEYQAPATLREAIDLLVSDPEATVIAGGQSLIPVLAFRLAAPSMLGPKLMTESGSRLTEAFIGDASGREGPFRPVVALDAHTTPPLPDELTLGRHIDLAV